MTDQENDLEWFRNWLRRGTEDERKMKRLLNDLGVPIEIDDAGDSGT
jgi:hypothetical protein